MSPQVASLHPRFAATPALSTVVELLLRAACRMRPLAMRGRHKPAAEPVVEPAIDTALPVDTPSRSYLQRVRMLSRLSPARELELVRRSRAAQSSEAEREAARREVIRANLWVVPVIVRRFYRQGGGFDDLVAEGNIGLYRAFERFDPDRGFRFSTYAKWWVVDAVTSAMAANAYPMRVPRKVAQALARRRREDVPRDAQGPPPAVCRSVNDADVPLDELGATVAIDDAEPVAEDAAHAVSDVSTEQVVALREALRVLARAVVALPARERRVIEGRFGLNGRSEETLQQIGDELGVTAERVRTLQLSAMKMLRDSFGEVLGAAPLRGRG